MAVIDHSQLTTRQSDIYEYIKKCIVEDQCPPTVRQIGNQFGIRSPNGVLGHLKALEKKKYIERDDNESRRIRVVGFHLEWVADEGTAA